MTILRGRFGSRRALVTAGTALMLAMAAQVAEAKRVFIDFGDGNFDDSGNAWDTNQSFELDRTGDLSCDGSPCTAIDLGFSINFGAGSFSSLYIHENGAVTFGSPLTEGSFTPAASLTSLGVPVIAPFYADLISADPTDGVFAVNPGEMLYSRGIADPDDESDGVYSLASAVPAIHVTWAGVTVTGDGDLNQVFTDLVIYSRGANGDFDLRFGYGDDFTPSTPALGSRAGFALGTNVNDFTGPYLSSTDYVYRFRDGAVVPVPAAAWLLVSALAGLAPATRFRRT